MFPFSEYPAASIRAGDLDGDGFPAAIIPRIAPGSTEPFFGDGHGGLAPRPLTPG